MHMGARAGQAHAPLRDSRVAVRSSLVKKAKMKKCCTFALRRWAAAASTELALSVWLEEQIDGGKSASDSLG